MSIKFEKKENEKATVKKFHLLREKGQSLGLQITASKNGGIFISHILDGGVAQRDGRLQVEDEVLFINGHPLISFSLQQAIAVLQTATNPIQIVVSRRLKSPSKNENKENINLNEVLAEADQIVKRENSENGVFKIILDNRQQKLGFSIGGSKQAFLVKAVLPGGIAQKDGRLRVGDEIIQVNEKCLKGLSHTQAVQHIKSIKKGLVSLVVRRRDVNPSDIQVITVKKVQGQGLGMGVASSTQNIVIKYIAKHSLLANEKLSVGDELVSVNGTLTETLALSDVHKMLRSLPPGVVSLHVKPRIQQHKTTGVKRTVSTQLMSPAVPLNAIKDDEQPAFSLCESNASADSSDEGSMMILKDEEPEVKRPPAQPSWMESPEGESPTGELAGCKYEFHYLILERDSKGHVGFGVRLSAVGENIQVFVKSVVAHGPAQLATGSEKGGMRVGDIIVQINDTPVKHLSSSEVLRLLKDMPSRNIIVVKRKVEEEGQETKKLKHDEEIVNLPGCTFKETTPPKSKEKELLPEKVEIPLGMFVKTIQVNKDETSPLGISLVPSHGRTKNYFQVRRILPGSPAEKNGKVLLGDVIYSVNAISMRSISHPQALKLLKSCKTCAQLTIFRKMELTPSVITKPPLQRQHSASSIKHTSDEESVVSSVATFISEASLVNNRTDYKPFVVEYEKTFRSLGVDVLMDGKGNCIIADVSPNGLAASNSLLRINDQLIAINNKSVTGKPVSYVNGLLRNLPRGKVKLTVQPPASSSDGSSVSTNKQDQNNIPRTTSCTSRRSLNLLDLSLKSSAASYIDDNASDVTTTMPCAPPRPVMNRRNSTYDSDSDYSNDSKETDDEIESMFSCLPPPPPRPAEMHEERNLSEDFSKSILEMSTPYPNDEELDNYQSIGEDRSDVSNEEYEGRLATYAPTSPPQETPAMLRRQLSLERVAKFVEKSPAPNQLSAPSPDVNQEVKYEPQSYTSPEKTFTKKKSFLSKLKVLLPSKGHMKQEQKTPDSLIQYLPDEKKHSKSPRNKRKGSLKKFASLDSESFEEKIPKTLKVRRAQSFDCSVPNEEASPHESIDNFRDRKNQSAPSAVSYASDGPTTHEPIEPPSTYLRTSTQNSMASRASSLQDLHFPPPPETDPDLEGSPELIRPSDQNNPKLQPFFANDEVNRHLQSRSSSVDGWGSEFSSALNSHYERPPDFPPPPPSINITDHSQDRLSPRDQWIPDDQKPEITFPPDEKLDITPFQENPIAKPPRKFSLDANQIINENPYQNSQSLHNQIPMQQVIAQVHAENLHSNAENFHSNADNFRPLPPYPEPQIIEDPVLPENVVYAQVGKKVKQKPESTEGEVYQPPKKPEISSATYSPKRRSARQKLIKEGAFHVQLLKSPVEKLGIVITGGRDTSVDKVLIREVDSESVARKCSTPLQSGDELLQINEHNVTGWNHLDVLNALKTSPPLLRLKISRKANCNVDLLQYLSQMELQQQPPSTRNEVVEISYKPPTKGKKYGLSTNSFDSSIPYTPPLPPKRPPNNLTPRRSNSALSHKNSPQNSPRRSNSAASLKMSERKPLRDEKLSRIAQNKPIKDKILESEPPKEERPAASSTSVQQIPKEPVIFSKELKNNKTPLESTPKKSESPKTIRQIQYERPHSALPLQHVKQVSDRPHSAIPLGSPKGVLKSPRAPSPIVNSAFSSRNSSYDSLVNVTHNQIVVFDMALKKVDGMGLGIGVYGGPRLVIKEGIKVKRLVADSVAAVDGQLKSGDYIIEINQTPLRGLTQADALGMLKSTVKHIMLRVARKQEPMETSQRGNSERMGAKMSPRSQSTSDIAKGSLPRGYAHGSSHHSSVDNIHKKRKRSITEAIAGRFRRSSNTTLHTTYFDKKNDVTEFTIRGGETTSSGRNPIVVASVMKGSRLSREMRAGDVVVSVQGLCMKDMSLEETKHFIRQLPNGRICLSLSRK